MFLSCTAFSVYEVVCVACLSSHANDFVNAKNLSSLLFIVPVINWETKFGFAMKSFGDFIGTI